MDFIYFIAGIVAAGIVAFVLSKTKSKTMVSIDECNLLKIEAEKLKSSITYKDENIIDLNSKLAESSKELRTQYDKNSSLSSELNSKIASLTEINDSLRKKLVEHSGELEEMKNKFKDEFENLANKIFEDKSSKFTQQNKESIDNILKPLKESIINFEQKVDSKHTTDIRDRQSIIEQIKFLSEQSNKISAEANNLAAALKGSGKKQGDWGEVLLESILENSGLVKGVNYQTQVSYKNKDGETLRPDAIIKLPPNKKIIVDSKVSLVAYERYCSSEDEIVKKDSLKEHVSSIVKHITELSDKKYYEYDSENTIDFVIMFIPIESAFSLAIKERPDLYDFAFRKRISISTVSNLYSTLRLIDTLWKQEIQNKSAMQVAKDCGALYDKFVGFANDMLKVGKSLDDSKNVYNEAMKKLNSGKGHIVGRIEKIRMLKSSDKNMPQVLLDTADIDDNDDVIDIDDNIVKIIPENSETGIG